MEEDFFLLNYLLFVVSLLVSTKAYAYNHLYMHIGVCVYILFPTCLYISSEEITAFTRRLL